jgi:hypothetical protein
MMLERGLSTACTALLRNEKGALAYDAAHEIFSGVGTMADDKQWTDAEAAEAVARAIAEEMKSAGCTEDVARRRLIERALEERDRRRRSMH